MTQGSEETDYAENKKEILQILFLQSHFATATSGFDYPYEYQTCKGPCCLAKMPLPEISTSVYPAVP